MRTENRFANVVRNSIRAKCSLCAEPVWITPATVSTMSDGQRSQIMCTDCWVSTSEDLGSIEPVTAAQVREIRQHFAERN